MKRSSAITAVLTIVLCICAQDTFARRGGGQRGGRRGQSYTPFARNYRAQAMQQQQMQQQVWYQHRHGGQNGMMRQSRFGIGGYLPQLQMNGQHGDNAAWNSRMYQQRTQESVRSRQADTRARNGAANGNMTQRRPRRR